MQAQRAMGAAAPSGIVMEGRDIGTIVFPNASVKIFLDASVEARGDRRLAQQGDAVESRQDVLNEMRERDTRDRSRTQSPLKAAADAIVLDTTALTLDQVLNQTAQIVATRLNTLSPETRPQNQR